MLNYRKYGGIFVGRKDIVVPLKPQIGSDCLTIIVFVSLLPDDGFTFNQYCGFICQFPFMLLSSTSWLGFGNEEFMKTILSWCRLGEELLHKIFFREAKPSQEEEDNNLKGNWQINPQNCLTV